MPQTDIYYALLGTQMGLEVTPGTQVAATRRMATLSIEVSPEVTHTLYDAQGVLVPVGGVLGSEMCSWTAKGPLDYNELPYLMNIFLASVAPTIATTVATWVWGPSATADAATDSWSLEWGNQGAGLGFQASLAKMTDFIIKANKKTVEVDIKGQAKSYTQGTTMTTPGTVTSVAKRSAAPRELNFYIAPSLTGLDSATALTRGYALELTVGGRYVANEPVNRLTPDF